MVVNQGPMIYVEWVKLSAGASLMANLLIMVMERAVATILLRSYERKTGDRWMIAAFFVILVCGIIGASIVITGFINIAILGIYGIFYTLFLVCVFIFSYRMNKKRYKESYRNTFSSYTLSERFQLCENIRSMNILKNSVYIMMVGNILVMVAIGLSIFQIITIYFIRKFVYCTIPIYAMVFVVNAILGAPAWKKEAKRLLIKMFGRFERKKISPSKSKRLPHLTTLNGRIMAFHLEEEGNLYFEQLAKSWE